MYRKITVQMAFDQSIGPRARADACWMLAALAAADNGQNTPTDAK
jgi:hypothetical protein